MTRRGRVAMMIAVAAVLLTVALVSADDPLFYNVQPKARTPIRSIST